MRSDATEHFCTLFDSNFLPMGLAQYASLEKHHGNFHLWVVCMDDRVESQLKALGLPRLSTITLEEMETPALREAKANRTRREYCWTLTSSTFRAVFARDPSLERVTYLDADVFFFADPSRLLSEFTETGKHVLYTDHAFAPEYEQGAASGKYCVQFLTARNTPEARKVIEWWCERCLEWCYDRPEPGRFGDQKYLEQWESLFPEETHVLRQTEQTLAPWNVEHSFRTRGFYRPVLYHFHSLRIVSPKKVRLFLSYPLSKTVDPVYEEYVSELRQAVGVMHAHGYPTPYLPSKVRRPRWVLSWFRDVHVHRSERYLKL
jgi:hypothetical protein